MILFSKKQRIFHTKEIKQDFTISSNIWIRDHRLSWKARGLLIFILQLPPDWSVNSEELQTHASDKRESTIAGLRELEHFGYAELSRERDPQTGRITQAWYFFETSKKPYVLTAKESNKKVKSKADLGPGLFDIPEEPEPKSPGTVFPVPVDPAPVFPEVESPASVKQPLLSTKNKVLMDQILKNQNSNTSREKDLAERLHKNVNSPNEKHTPWNFPALWLESFQRVYSQEHGMSMGEPISELKSLQWIYKTTNGDWSQVHFKIQILIQLRSEDGNFWAKQAVSPETLSKFWTRLFPQDQRRQASKERYPKRKNETAPNKKDIPLRRPSECFIDPDKPEPKTRHECFLQWAERNLYNSLINFYKQNRDPATYVDGKKIIYEKYFRECAPPKFRNSEFEIRKELTRGAAKEDESDCLEKSGTGIESKTTRVVLPLLAPLSNEEFSKSDERGPGGGHEYPTGARLALVK
ncbi:hypothetical protein [Leptospira weilii]|uniref:hypothetical protein n=1 Tax=Leptospira weilii TaxID=28184 RepID=UPI001EF2052B|nr:hypothetical protein [Leptospira weilii]ULH30952.1 hypothetical protein FH586_22135 [Leptospira weilii]